MALNLFSSTTAHQRMGIAIIRIATGVVFAMHGYQKLFVFGIPGVVGAFTKMGIFMPSVMGPFIALLELAGGLALIIGLLSRLAALGLALDMVGAILFVHMAGGFFLPTGMEYAFTLLCACLAVTLAGPGALSVDANIAARQPGPLGTRGMADR